MIFLKRRALMTRASFNYKTVNGIGSITLENCVETRFKRLVLSGNSAQTTTKGINLIPFKVGETITAVVNNTAVFKKDGVDITLNSIVMEVQSDLYFFGSSNYQQESGYSDALPAGEYTFLSNSKLCNFFVVAWRNGTTELIVERSDKLITHFTVLDGDKVRLFLRPKGNANLKGTEKAQVMLCKHTEINLPYEPYTGGKPSPSVEYPQEIVNAGDSGQIDVKVSGKNLLDISKVKIEHDEEKVVIKQTNLYIKLAENFEDNTRYTVSFESYKNDGGSNHVLFEYVYTDGSKSEWYANSIPKKGFTSDANKTINYLWIRNPWKAYAEITKIQVEKGIERTEYEAYKEPQILQLQLDEPLRGIGEYKDVITKDGIVRKIKEIVLDENTGFTNHLGGTQNKTICFVTHILKDATNIAALNNAMSDKIEKVLYVDLNDKECFALFNKQIYIKLSRERNIDTVEKLKEWLKQNPIKIQYLLQEPVLEPFENSLDSLHANDGTTIITVDSGEVETGIEVEYAVKE